MLLITLAIFTKNFQFLLLHIHLHNLFAKPCEHIQQIPVQGAKKEMSEYICVAKVINNFGIIIMK